MSVEVTAPTISVRVVSQSDGAVRVLPSQAVRVVSNGEGPPGQAGAPAKVSVGFAATGPYSARQAVLPAPLTLAGSGTLTAANSHARAFTACTSQNVWSVTRNGTFASEAFATDIEIASALFATITFPARPGKAVWSYPNGGDFVDGDALRVWESANPDATQAATSVTFAGA